MPPLARAALGLAVAPMVAVGLARFSYALLLPAMRGDLGWSYAALGAINAANAAGYLAGALVAARVGSAIGARRAVLGGVLVTALALIASAATTALPWHLLWRTIAGIGGAVAFIVGAGIAVASARAGGARPGRVIAVYFGGGGAGILVSSLVLPPLLGLGAGGWRLGWLALAASSLAGLAFAARTVPNENAAPAFPPAAEQATAGTSLLPTYAAYVCFGAGYVGYITFIIALLREGAVPAATITTFWAMLGLAVVATSFVWGAIFDRLGPGRPLLAVLLLEAAGATLPLLSTAWPSLFASALLFGSGLMAAPGAVTVAVRNALPPASWTAAVGRMAVAFGLGQCTGPLASGYLADTATGIATGLAASALLLVAGAVIAFFQR